MGEASDIMSTKTIEMKEATGIRFWSKLIIPEDIMNAERCSQVLETLNSVIESTQTYGTITSYPETKEISENDLISTIQRNEAEYVKFPKNEEFSSLFLGANDLSACEH